MGCWVQPLAARAAREPDPRWMMAALRGQGARSQVVMASAARSGEPGLQEADGAAPNRPGKNLKFSPIRGTTTGRKRCFADGCGSGPPALGSTP